MPRLILKIFTFILVYLAPILLLPNLNLAEENLTLGKNIIKRTNNPLVLCPGPHCPDVIGKPIQPLPP